ncbi:hypothetical protein CRG98_044893, partial [Punica granatum]
MKITDVLVLLSLLCAGGVSGRRNIAGDVIELPSEASRFFHAKDDVDDDSVGTRWAILIAGSNGYWNYRHQ